VPARQNTPTIHSQDYAELLRLLLAARRKAKLTQIDMSNRLRITQPTISKIERGEIRLDIIQLRNWCRALGVNFADFVIAFDKAVGGGRRQGE